MPSFRKVISRVLKRTTISRPIRKALLHKPYINEFKICFVSERSEEEQTRQIYKILGDYLLDDIVGEYLYTDRFARYRSEKWLTRIKHNLISSRPMLPFARAAGFVEYITVPYVDDAELATLKPGKRAAAKRIDLTNESDEFAQEEINNTIKAVCGCIERSVDMVMAAKGKTPAGYGRNIVTSLILPVIREIPIKTGYMDVFDSITILKEYYTDLDREFKGEGDCREDRCSTRQPYNRRIACSWKYGDGTVRVIENKSPEGITESYTVNVYGYDRRITPNPSARSRVCIASVTHGSRTLATQMAATEALQTLRTKYGMVPPRAREIIS